MLTTYFVIGLHCYERDMFSWKLMIPEQKCRAVVSLKVECLSSMEVGPFPSFIERVSVIVRATVGSHQPLVDQAISVTPAGHRKTDASMHPSEWCVARVRTRAFFERDRTIDDVLRHRIAYNAITKKTYIVLRLFYIELHINVISEWTRNDWRFDNSLIE